MRTPHLIGAIAVCILLAGCDRSNSLTQARAQLALDKIPHSSGKVTFSKIRVLRPNVDATVDTSFTDFGYVERGVRKKYTGAGWVLFTNRNPKEGDWRLTQVHLGDPPIYFLYDIVAEQPSAIPGWLKGKTADFVYQVCAAVFLFQGLALPFIVIAVGLVWYRQHRLMKALEKHLLRREAQEEAAAATPDLILQGLPKLQPLNCPACGAGVLLQKKHTFCPHCQTLGELPVDYAALAPLQRHLEKLTKRALRYWRVDYGLTLPFTERFFKLLIFLELLVFPVALLGEQLFPKKIWIEHFMSSLSERESLGVSLAAFFGLVLWMLLFYLLCWLTRELRTQLPMVPALPPSLAVEEVTNCRDCGGAVGYEEGAFAAICPYCHVINLRAQLVRRERTRGKQQKTKTKSILFGAMEILDDFIGSFVFFGAILLLVSVLVVAFRGCEIFFHNLIPKF